MRASSSYNLYDIQWHHDSPSSQRPRGSRLPPSCLAETTPLGYLHVWNHVCFSHFPPLPPLVEQPSILDRLGSEGSASIGRPLFLGSRLRNMRDHIPRRQSHTRTYSSIVTQSRIEKRGFCSSNEQQTTSSQILRCLNLPSVYWYKTASVPILLNITTFLKQNYRHRTRHLSTN